MAARGTPTPNMMKQSRRVRATLAGVVSVSLVAFVALLFVFPGSRLGLAFVIATGIGRSSLQARIDRVESKAIRSEKLTEKDRAFLLDFYSTLAAGGKLSIVARQTGAMLTHYLNASGNDYQLEPSIFTDNERVQRQAELLRRRLRSTPCSDGHRVSSPTFYMPDASNLDSVFGLYHGQLHVTQRPSPSGECILHWRAEVPWVWPSYASLTKKYGDPHAESFPLPSAISLAFGREHSLFVDNGLGHHLEIVGLARSFLAFAEWTTTTPQAR